MTPDKYDCYICYLFVCWCLTAGLEAPQCEIRFFIFGNIFVNETSHGEEKEDLYGNFRDVDFAVIIYKWAIYKYNLQFCPA